MNKLRTVLYMPDGNRRFSEEKGISYSKSYLFGAKSLKLFSEYFITNERASCFVWHVMSDYTHKRLDDSMKPIYDALIFELNKLHSERFFIDNNMNVEIIDDSGMLPPELLDICEKIVHSTRNNLGGKIIVLLGYSLKRDFERALSCDCSSYESFMEEVKFSNIDLVIRPKEMRLSRGPIYAMEQAQMMVIDKYNPEICKKDLDNLMKEFKIIRNYRVKNAKNPHSL